MYLIKFWASHLTRALSFYDLPENGLKQWWWSHLPAEITTLTPIHFPSRPILILLQHFGRFRVKALVRDTCYDWLNESFWGVKYIETSVLYIFFALINLERRFIWIDEADRNLISLMVFTYILGIQIS